MMTKINTKFHIEKNIYIYIYIYVGTIFASKAKG